jgi:hypothetical protein
MINEITSVEKNFLSARALSILHVASCLSPLPSPVGLLCGSCVVLETTSGAVVSPVGNPNSHYETPDF